MDDSITRARRSFQMTKWMPSCKRCMTIRGSPINLLLAFITELYPRTSAFQQGTKKRCVSNPDICTSKHVQHRFRRPQGKWTCQSGIPLLAEHYWPLFKVLVQLSIETRDSVDATNHIRQLFEKGHVPKVLHASYSNGSTNRDVWEWSFTQIFAEWRKNHQQLKSQLVEPQETHDICTLLASKFPATKDEALPQTLKILWRLSMKVIIELPLQMLPLTWARTWNSGPITMITSPK